MQILDIRNFRVVGFECNDGGTHIATSTRVHLGSYSAMFTSTRSILLTAYDYMLRH